MNTEILTKTMEETAYRAEKRFDGLIQALYEKEPKQDPAVVEDPGRAEENLKVLKEKFIQGFRDTDSLREIADLANQTACKANIQVIHYTEVQYYQDRLAEELGFLAAVANEPEIAEAEDLTKSGKVDLAKRILKDGVLKYYDEPRFRSCCLYEGKLYWVFQWADYDKISM